MPYASASGGSANGLHAIRPDPVRESDVGESERGDMTRLRGSLPPVVSVACALCPDATGAPRLLGAVVLPDDANR